MREHSANVERLLGNRCFKSFSGSSNNEGIDRYSIELLGDCCHVNHAGHVGMSQKALRMIYWICNLSQVSTNALVAPDLLKGVIWVENWGCCTWRLLCLSFCSWLLWGLSFFWREFNRFWNILFWLLGFRNSSFLSPKDQIIWLDMLEYVTFVDIAL